MSARRAGLDAALRLRERELEQARIRSADAQRGLADARERVSLLRARLDAAQQTQSEQARGGVAAVLARATAGRVATCRNELAQATGAEAHAAQAFSEARAVLLAARTRFEALSRLLERRRQAERSRRERKQQLRLDDYRTRRSPYAPLLVGLALLPLLAGPVRAEPPRATPATEALLAEVRTRIAQLDARERQLERREHELDELQARVETRMQEILDLSALTDERIQAWEEHKDKRVRQLAKIYGAMPPGSAARLVDALDADLATQIVAAMKPKQSAAVLALLSSNRALTVSRQVARPLSFDPPETEETH